jgi:hypothetical protein
VGARARPRLHGVVVLAIRRGRLHHRCSCRRPGAAAAGYQVAGAAASFQHVPMDPARFDVDNAGVDLDVGTTLADGRVLRLRIRERQRGPRWSVDMLAPAGVSMTRPAWPRRCASLGGGMTRGPARSLGSRGNAQHAESRVFG